MCIKFLYTHFLKFRSYDPNLSSPGQTRFYCFSFVNHSLTHSCFKYLHCSAIIFVIKVFLFLQFPALKCRGHFFFKSKICLCFLCNLVKLKRCGNDFCEFYILEKLQRYSCLQKCFISKTFSSKCFHKLIEFNQSATEF